MTPTSTPPSEQENSGQMAADQNGADVFSENLSDTALHDKIYDKWVKRNTNICFRNKEWKLDSWVHIVTIMDKLAFIA